MSDYLFMLENHLSAEQSAVVAEVQAAAAQAHANLFLTGGAMRDMLAGFPIRDLDFRVEGSGIKLAKALEKAGAKILTADENRKLADLLFPNGVTVEISMARKERFPKPGAKPQVQPASIHDDLRGRDFTINSIALSLNAGSKGLLLDPNNGQSDIQQRELRAINNYVFYDDPVRLLRLIRFQVRMGYAVEERTRMQFENARDAGMLARITSDQLASELRAVAEEPNIADLMEALEREKMIELFSPALTGPKLNLPAFHKLQKAKQLISVGVPVPVRDFPLFLSVLIEKLNAKERTALSKTALLTRADFANIQKLEAAAKKAERDLKSAKVTKPSHIYHAILAMPGEVILHLLLHSQQRIVQDRIKNYFGKYLITAIEVTDKEVAATGVPIGSPKFQKAKEALIVARLDGRAKKPAPPPEPPPPPPAPTGAFARRH